MKFSKVEKPLTVIDAVTGRLEKVWEEKERQNEEARKTIKKLNEERAVLKAEHDRLAGQVELQTREYTAIRAEQMAVEAEAIKEASITEDNLQAGEVNIREFLQVGKRRADIAKEAEAAAEEKLAKVRQLIRAVRIKMYEIIVSIRELDEKIAYNFSSHGAFLYDSLKKFQTELEMAGVTRPDVFASHGRTKEARNDLALVKGGCLFNVAVWTVKNIAEAEAIALDPRLQEKHLPELKAFIEEARTVEFLEMTVRYVPAEWNGRGAGSIWYDFRPPIMR